jgi:putative ABC transport system ATP-binding protein
MENECVIEVEKLTKTYNSEHIQVKALRCVDLKIKRGEFTAIAGPSGSGKTTLLNVMSGLDSLTSGKVTLAGTPLGEMSSAELADFRKSHVGFIFQSYNLIAVLTVAENIEYVMLLQGIDAKTRRRKISEILKEVGLGGKEDIFPYHLSGGQQQRVAIARAVVSGPDIILADEPTANLDSHTGEERVDMMHKLNETRNMTFVFSTHDKMIMEKSERLIMLKDGAIISDEQKNKA